MQLLFIENWWVLNFPFHVVELNCLYMEKVLAHVTFIMQLLGI